MISFRALFLLALFALTGCARHGPEADLDTYIARLGRVLEQVPPEIPVRVMPRLPDVRDLHESFRHESINILELLEIRDCELGHVVAEHNSVLGKVAVASQQLIYELNFLRTGEACLAVIGKDHPKLSETLQRELANARRDLPAYIWQATLGGEEFREFWHFGNLPLKAEFEPDDKVILAMKDLRADAGRWLSGDYTVDADRLENLLDVIRSGDGGLELRAWQTLESKLDIADAVLDARAARRPLCFAGMHPPAADIFGNVVADMLIGRIQPWVARLNARYYSVFPEVRGLEAALAAGEPQAYHDWRNQRDVEMDRATASLVRHVNSLQPLLAQCNLMPATR